MKGKTMRYLCALAAIIFLGSVAQGYAAKEIVFHEVDNPEILTFAVEELRGEIKTSTEEEWVQAVKDHALYAEVDIDDDGVPERFIQFNYACGTVGCFTMVYKRKVRPYIKGDLQGVGIFEDICDVDMTGNDPQTYLLKEKENGYHQISTGDNEIIHWDIDKKSGKVSCWRDEKP